MCLLNFKIAMKDILRDWIFFFVQWFYRCIIVDQKYPFARINCYFFFGDGIIFNFSRQNWWHSDRISDSGYRWPVTNCVHKILGSRTHGTSLALIPRIIRFTEIETGVVDLIHLYNEDCAYQWQIVKKSLPPWKLKGFRSSSRSGCILDAGNNSLHLGMIEGRVEEKDLFHLNILW